MLLIDVDAVVQLFQEQAFTVLNQIERDSDEVPDYIKGQIEGLSIASNAFIQHITSNMKFADFPKEKEKKTKGKNEKGSKDKKE